MKKTINEIWLQITSKIPVDRKLEMGKDYVVEIKLCKYERKVRDNQDGSVDLIEVTKPLEVKIK